MLLQAGTEAKRGITPGRIAVNHFSPAEPVADGMRMAVLRALQGLG